jgi:transglutaminase-like putative cysteine protease
MCKSRLLAVLYLLLSLAATASAQFDFTPNEADGARYIGGPRLGDSRIQTYRAGVILEPGTALNTAFITVPVPMAWKEQRIISINEEKMKAGLASRVVYRPINGGAMEMYVQLDNVRLTRPLEIVVEAEVQNYELLPPDNPGQYVIPSRVPKEVDQYLLASPCIESKDSTFAKMYKDITKNRSTDWDKVEALYSFVQNNVKYDNTAWNKPAKGALAVTKMKGQWTGDCKDMCCLFVALCRAGKIPARIVRVPEHCYAEFYLESKQDKRPRNGLPMGFWFPCQVAGTYSFGGIPEQRVILQKGDSFPDAEKPNAKTLWLRESFQGTPMSGSPSPPEPRWVHETVLK